MTARTRLVIDGGQTGTRLRLRNVGRTIEQDSAGIRTDRPVVEQIAVAARNLLATTSVDEVRELAVGLSGLTPQHSRADALLDAVADLGVESVALAHDSVSAYLAANRYRPGAVTAAGTGVVTLGVGVAGTARVDGWGHLFGDAGSAYWIGRAGIDAAMRAFDGRGRATLLEDAATQVFGALPELYMLVQGDPDRVSRVAAFARRVDEAADAGDQVADGIRARAASELAMSAHTALIRSGWRPGEPARVSWMGRVIADNAAIRDLFCAEVAARARGVEVGPPLGTSLDGVEALIDLPAGHMLTPHVHAASRPNPFSRE